jgi:hypothetical protein
MSTDQQLGWLRNLSKAQLSEATLAVVQIQKEVNALATRVNGEHELRSLGWERRLALAKREWQDDLEAMRTECSIMLKEADELVALQREEAELYREEALLRVAQRDAAEQKVLMLQGSQRRLVLRARGIAITVVPHRDAGLDVKPAERRVYAVRTRAPPHCH